MASWLNHVAIAAPRNGSASHTVSPSSGTAVAGALFTPTAGRLLVCVVEGSVTSTTPSGWTLPSGGSAINYTGLYVWWRTAAGGDTLTTTHNGSNYPVVFDFYEFPAGSSFLGSASATGVPWSNGAGPTLSLSAGTKWIAGALGQALTDTSGTITASWGAGVEAVDTFALKSGTDGYLYSLTYLEDSTLTSAQISSSSSSSSGGTTERLMFAVQVASTDPTGSVALTGSGSVAPVGVPGTVQSRNGSGSGSLTLTGSPAVPGAVSLSGAGAVGTAGTPGFGGGAGLAGAGSLTGTGSSTGSGLAGLAGAGALMVDGDPAMPGVGTLAGAGDLSVAGTAAVPGQATSNGGGTLSTTTTAGLAGQAGLDAAGTLSVTGAATVNSQAGLVGVGTLTVQPPGGVVLSGSGQLGLASGLSATGQVALAPAGGATGVASVVLTGTGALSMAAVPGGSGLVSLAGSGVLHVDGSGLVGLSGVGLLGVDSTVHVAGLSGSAGGGVLAVSVLAGVTGLAGFGGDGGLVADRLGLAVVDLAGAGGLQLVGLVPPVPVRSRPRIRLNGSRARRPGPTVRLGRKATIMVDGSCCGCDTPPGPDPTLTEFTVRARDRDGYDDDGNPRYVWVDVLTGPALEWSTRTEIDQTAGITRVTGVLVMANPAGVTIHETGIAVSGGMVWSITKTVPGPAGIKLHLLRLDHDE